MAGYYGTGKYKNYLSSFLVGTINSNGNIIPISKVGTGLNEEFL